MAILASAGRIRRYDEKLIFQLRFIKRAQQLGFSLDEVRNLLTLEDGQSCRETQKLAEKRLVAIDERVADLRRTQQLLKDLIAD